MRMFSVPFVLFVAALAIRLAYIEDIRRTPTFESPLVDAYVYDESARMIAEHGPSALEVPYYQPPLYPMVLGGVYAVAGRSYVAPRVFHALLGALTCVLLFWIASRCGERERRTRAGVVAGVLWLAYGPALYFEGELLPVTLILCLDTAAVALALVADRSRDPRGPLALSGLALGLSVATRPTALLTAIGFGAWWLARRRERRGVALALAALAVVLAVGPFTVANRVGGRESILVSWNGGINFYVGNGADSDSLVAIQPGAGWDRLQREPLKAGVTTRAAESRYWTRRALDEAAREPRGWLAALGRKVLRFLDHGEAPRNTSYEAFRSQSTLLSLPLPGFGWVAPLALLGLLAGALDRRARLLFLVVIAAVAVENLAFFVTGRYRLAAVPVLCVLSGVGVDSILGGGARRVGVLGIAALVALIAVVHVDLLGERDVDEARVQINRGVALRRRGFDAGATKAFRAALAASPEDADAHRWLGEIALGERDLPRAIEHFSAALKTAPDYVRAHLGLAQTEELRGRRREAETAYLDALRIDPWSWEVRLNYGVFLAVDGRTEEARTMFEEGLRLSPGNRRLAANLERLNASGS